VKDYVVARRDEVPEGGRAIVEVNGHSIGVFCVEGEYYALLNRCPHQGAELCRGSVLGEIKSSGPGDFDLDEGHRYLVCPWHGWEFDLATGQSYFDPRRTRVRPYPVAVEDGAVLVGEADEDRADGRRKGPYVAGVLEVRVDEDYLVVTLPG
jgi:3-phenylpropionate/trans-cinnamate dioxygenase ferredoxin subunit